MSNWLKQKATYWSFLKEDGYGGRTFNAPMTVDCRWEEVQEQFLNRNGEVDLSKAIIYLSPVDGNTYKIGDYLLLGTSADLVPTNVAKTFQVRQVMRTPNLRLVKTEIRVIL